MLTIFTGDDVTKAKAEAQKRAKGAQLVRFGEGGESYEMVGGYLEQQGMFAPKVVLLLDRPLEDAVGKALLQENTDVLVESDTLVIAIQPTIDAVTKKKLPKKVEIEEFALSSLESARDVPPNVFALTDAFAAGDRKGAWVTYRTLMSAGAQPEEVHGALAWAVRGMVMAGKTKSAAEAGMKDYPYRKAKSAVARMGVEKAEAVSAELVDLYHRARMGAGDLEDLLEVFLLQK